jgi:hypothetical protein
VTAVRELRATAIAVAPFVGLMWLAAAGVAATADGYDQASWWLLLLNQLLLVPVLAGSAWWLGRMVAGAVGAVAFPVAVVLVPVVGVLYANERFRETYTDRVLTEAVGIAAGGQFAAGALLLGSVSLLVAALARDRVDAVLAAAGAALALVVIASAMLRGGIGLDVSWRAFDANMGGLREFTWSNRLLQWLPLAGAVGMARCSLPAALLVGGWFGAFALAWGASPNVGVGDGSFSAAFVPALPAFSLLVASVPLLVPTLPARLERDEITPWSRDRPSRDTPSSGGRSDP